MGYVYRRGNNLWLSYTDENGTRRRKPSGFAAGDEGLAREALRIVEHRLSARVKISPDGPVTLRAYAESWLAERPGQGIATADDEAGRLRGHVLPILGDMALGEIRPRHVRDLVRELRRRKSARGEPLAPRTVWNIYGVMHRMMHDAVVDELIPTNPCVLKHGELPAKIDKDPTWRARAVFTREEIEAAISDERIPEDRRMFWALTFFAAGTRFGESAALRWRHYDATATPLGKLLVAVSFSTKKRVEKSVKTGKTREVPVHPTLAKMLAAWKLGGYERMFGRTPQPDDLIVPSREGRHRNANHMLKRFHEDLGRLGLRKRRQHDLRRTFISLAQADGARKDVLRWITHGPTGDIMDTYTTLPWPTLCEAVSSLRIYVREGQVIPFAKVVNSHELVGEPGTTLAQPLQPTGTSVDFGRGGRDSNPRPPA
jgi:integrase